MKASDTLREYQAVGRCLPTPKCHTHRCAERTSLHPTMWWPSSDSGTKMKKSSGRQRTAVLEKSPLSAEELWHRLLHDSRSGTTRTKSTGTWPRLARSHSATVTWVPGTLPRHTPSSHEGGGRDCSRPGPQAAVKQFHDSEIKFRLPHRVMRGQHNPRFTIKRPNTFF